MASKEEQLFSTENDPLVHYSSSKSRSTRIKKYCLVAVLLALVIACVGALVIGLGAGLGSRSSSSALYKSVKATNLVNHLKELESIAGFSNNSRAVQYGYNRSAEYVISQLTAAGYTNVSEQEFTIGIPEVFDGSLSAIFNGLTLGYTFGIDFTVMRYSGSTEGDLQKGLAIVDGSGCDTGSYIEESIALVNYDTNADCTIFEMVKTAKSANVDALLMMRTEDDPFRTSPPNARLFSQTVDDFEIVDLPVLGVTYQVGQTLRDIANNNDLQLSISASSVTTFYSTYNVLAYTLDGATDSVIVVGSHLDSVPAGPGINDNGSGSMANLEMAIQLAKSNKKPVNQVLFAFWGAEEWGLLGSHHFVKTMIEDGTISDIALNLNYDMIGSPNYVRQVYNGTGAENEKVVNGSTKIQSLFEDFFKSQGLPYDLTSFNGRSDYGPFIEEGTDIPDFNGRSDYGPFIADGVDIPAGGLATGADETKTADERLIYGGLANAILDPCYHQYCDTVDNIDQGVYEEMSQCAAYVLEELMMKENLKDFLAE